MAEETHIFKKFIEFFGDTKTIIEFLTSIGAGKAVEAMLRTLTKLPPEWITPIWLFATALFLWAISAIVAKITKKPHEDEKTKIQENQTQVSLTETTTSLEIDTFWRSYDNALLVGVEATVREMSDRCQAGAERERYLIRYVATREIINYFERVWRDILGSQIEALEALNPASLRSEQLEIYYLTAAATYTDSYATFTFESWIRFMLTNDLVSESDGSIITLTLFGREFLKYIISS